MSLRRKSSLTEVFPNAFKSRKQPAFTQAAAKQWGESNLIQIYVEETGKYRYRVGPESDIKIEYKSVDRRILHFVLKDLERNIYENTLVVGESKPHSVDPGKAPMVCLEKGVGPEPWSFIITVIGFSYVDWLEEKIRSKPGWRQIYKRVCASLPPEPSLISLLKHGVRKCTLLFHCNEETKSELLQMTGFPGS